MAKQNEFIHIRHVILSLLYSDDSLYHRNLIAMKENCNFQLISGLQTFENFISGFHTIHQKTRNEVLRVFLNPRMFWTPGSRF